ncbi:MAG: hypothetical protein BWY88_01363 [Synergistetes bacterium ADurb.Bin520]|nr:MAG: hypothetical protein BWY88_01363 [Synergistetes bacterium ADurb.Bin520]
MEKRMSSPPGARKITNPPTTRAAAPKRLKKPMPPTTRSRIMTPTPATSRRIPAQLKGSILIPKDPKSTRSAPEIPMTKPPGVRASKIRA